MRISSHKMIYAYIVAFISRAEVIVLLEECTT